MYRTFLLTLILSCAVFADGIHSYIALFQQGESLVNRCDAIKKRAKYSTFNDEQIAKRTIVSTLQYVGIKKLIDTIGGYATILEIDEKKYDTLRDNLIENTCSPNMTLFSKKRLKALFKTAFENKDISRLPSTNNKKYFSKDVLELLSSKDAKKKEFKRSLENFRSLCSWNHDVGDYRLLGSLISNPFIMSHVFNELRQKEISYNKERKYYSLKDSDKTDIVSCKNMICRKVDKISFDKQFPRMLGSADLKDDFDSLYCDHFRYQTISKSKSDWVNKVAKTKTDAVVNIETMNLVSLLTGVVDIFSGVDQFDGITDLLKRSVTSHWDKWAAETLSAKNFKLNYEESLQIDLISQKESAQSLAGNFSIKFRYTLGEFDRIFNSYDKISAIFDLNLPKKYLTWYKREFITQSNKSNQIKLEDLKNNLVFRINRQLEQKTKFFLTDLWTDEMASIVADDLVAQLMRYRGSEKLEGPNTLYTVPVELEFGTFALKFIRDKYKFRFYKNSIISQN